MVLAGGGVVTSPGYIFKVERMKKFKKIICLLLVFILCFMLLADPIVQPPADAIVLTATASMIAVGATMLAMIGITFATAKLAELASRQIVTSRPDIFDWVQDVIDNGSGSNPPPPGNKEFKLSAGSSAGFATFVNEARRMFTGKKSTKVFDRDILKYQGTTILKDEVYPDSWSNVNYYNILQYNMLDHNTDATAIRFTTTDGDIYAYKCTLNPDTNVTVWYSFNGGPWSAVAGYDQGYKFYISLPFSYFNNLKSLTEVRFGFQQRTSNGVTNLCPCIGAKWQNTNAIYKYITMGFGNVFSPASVGGFPLRDSSPEFGSVDVPFKTDNDYKISDVYKTLTDEMERGDITIDYTDTLEEIENSLDKQLSITQEQLLLQTQILDILEKIKAGQELATPGPPEESDFDPPDLDGEGLLDKFPFCVPKDLYLLVTALNAEPLAPKWTIPIKFDIVNYYEEFDFDLADYEVLVTPIRWGLTILFLAGLILVSRKMIKG